MAGTIKTPPATAAFRDGRERNFGTRVQHVQDEFARYADALQRSHEELRAALLHEDTKELEEAVAGEDESEADELVGRVECAYCGRTDLEAGQQCACLDRASGSAYGCRRCGRAAQHVGELCDGCEWERDRPRRERAARAAGLLRG